MAHSISSRNTINSYSIERSSEHKKEDPALPGARDGKDVTQRYHMLLIVKDSIGHGSDSRI